MAILRVNLIGKQPLFTRSHLIESFGLPSPQELIQIGKMQLLDNLGKYQLARSTRSLALIILPFTGSLNFLVPLVMLEMLSFSRKFLQKSN
jgi:hypothetical protein